MATCRFVRVAGTTPSGVIISILFEPVLDPTIAAVHSAACTAAVDVCANKEMTRPAAVRSVFLLLGPPQAAAGVAKALTNGLPPSPVSSLSSSNPMESKKVWRKKRRIAAAGTVTGGAL